MFVDSFLFFLFKGQEDAKSKQLERQPVVKDLNQLANHLSLLPIYISPWLNIHPEKNDGWSPKPLHCSKPLNTAF